jgi:RNA polymerase sigma-70 factor (ECF subfamily)
VSESIADTIERAVRGDEAALTELLARFGGRLRQHIDGSIGSQWRSALDADDVVQVTFLEAFLRIGSLSARDEAGFFAWIRKIADNNLRDAIRSLDAAKRPSPKDRVRANSGEDSAVALVEMLGAASVTPSRDAARDEAAILLEKALARLPSNYEKVIRLYDLEGRSIEEVAGELKRSHGAVYMLRGRAHDALRDAMGTPSMFFTHGP